MSRHNLKSLNPQHHEVVVGWDRPLQHWFAQIFRVNPMEDEEEVVIAFEDKDITKFMEKVTRRLGSYCFIPSTLQVTLEEDVALDYPKSNRIVTWNETEIVREVEW